jgi:transcription elongation factor Elf1
MMDPRRTCPRCGEHEVDCVEVDIGVGVQCGPRSCNHCGWSEDDEACPFEALGLGLAAKE